MLINETKRFLGKKFLIVVYPVRMAVEVISMQNGGGSNENDVIDNACEDVRARGCARKSRTFAKA